MKGPAIPSVDQLLVLLTVAEEGSFTAAAKRLGRATSAISYAIDTLEAQLGLSDTPPGPAGRWLIERLVTLSDGPEPPVKEIAKPTKGKGRHPSTRKATARQSRR